MSAIRKHPRLMHMVLRLAESGWFVFPLRPRDKRPALSFTQWERRATRDPNLIYRWWNDAPYNIAIATGPSRLLVIDCDISRGEPPPPMWSDACNGLDVLNLLARDAGHHFPDTLRIRTPTGGTHLYFTAPAHPVLSNTAGQLGWRIDTRGAGGYVVAAGSIHPQGYYTITENAPVTPLPTWLISALAPRIKPRAPKPQLPLRSTSRYLQAILGGEAQRIANAAPGCRNNALNTAAYVLGRLVGGGELNEAHAWATLLNAANRHVSIHQFTEREITRTIRSGITAGARYPRCPTERYKPTTATASPVHSQQRSD